MSNSHIHLDSFADKMSILPATMAVSEIIQGIYCGFDTRNGEPLYVGLSENIRSRIYQHIQQLNRSSKTKIHWDEDFKADSSLIEWKLLEVVAERSLLNARELYWWTRLDEPRLNVNSVSSKWFRTGGDTRKKNPGYEKLSSMRASGMNAREMAEALGVSRTSIYGWFSEANDPLYEFAERRSANSLRQKTRDFMSIESNVEMLMLEIKSGSGFLSTSIKYELDRGVLKDALESRGISISKYTHTSNEQLYEQFPKELIESALKKEQLYAHELAAQLGISGHKMGALLDRYDLRSLLKVRFKNKAV